MERYDYDQDYDDQLDDLDQLLDNEQIGPMNVFDWLMGMALAAVALGSVWGCIWFAVWISR